MSARRVTWTPAGKVGGALLLGAIATLSVPAAADPPPGSMPFVPPGPVQGAPFGPPGAPPGPPVFAPPPASIENGSAPPDWTAIAVADGQFKSKKRMIIAGASLFGLSYYISLTASSVGVSRNNKGSKEYIAGLFPLAGPFVAGILRAVPNDPQPADYAGMGMYLGIGAVQVLGTALFLVGLRMPTGRPRDPCAEKPIASGPAPIGNMDSILRRLAPCSSISASLQPIVTPTFTGGGLTGTF